MAYQSEIEKLEQRFNEKPEQWFAALADAYRKAGELDRALEIVEQWIEQRPNYTSGLIVLGRVRLDRKEDQQAAEAFEKVLSIDGENIIAVKSLSEICQRAGDEDGVRRWLERLLEIDPLNEEAQEALLALAPAEEGAAAPVEAAPVEEGVGLGLEPTDLSEASVEEEAATTVAEAAEPAEVPEAAPGELVIEKTADEGSEATIEMGAVEVEAAEAAPAAEAAQPPEAAGEQEEAAAAPAAPAAPVPPAGAEGEDEGLELAPFDDELAWGTGERVSRAITGDDVAQAEEAHEESLDSVAHAIPGLEAAEVPEVGTEDREEFQEEPEGEVGVGEAARTSGDLELIMPEDVTPKEEIPEEPPPEPAQEPEPVVTETMAELYAKQGLIEEARDVYRELVARRPNEPQLAARLQELEAQAATAAAGPVAPQPAPRAGRYSVAVTGGQSARAMLRGMLGAEAPLEQAFGAEPEAPSGKPTAPAGDEVSLGAVFGDEPSEPPPGPPAPPDAGEGGSKGGAPGGEGSFSFDEFFGEKEQGSAEQPGGGPAGGTGNTSGEGGKGDFQDWLKGLKK